MSPRTNEGHAYITWVPYASAIGNLMYAMVCTRPDISHSVSMINKYMHDHGKGHWQIVKWILRYLFGTADVRLILEKVD